MNLLLKKTHNKEKKKIVNIFINLFLSSFISYLITFPYLFEDLDTGEWTGFVFFLISLVVFFFLSEFIIRLNSNYLKKILKIQKLSLYDINRYNRCSFIPFSVSGILFIILYLFLKYFFHHAINIGKINIFYPILQKINLTFIIIFLIISFIATLISQYTIINKHIKKLIFRERVLLTFTSIPSFLFLNLIVGVVLWLLFQIVIFAQDFAGAFT